MKKRVQELFEKRGGMIWGCLPPITLLNKHLTGRTSYCVCCDSLFAQTLVSLELSHPSPFFLQSAPCLFSSSTLGRLPSLSLNSRLFDTACLGGLLFTQTSKSVFLVGVLYALSRFFNMLVQSLSGVILLLNLAAKGRITKVYVVFVTGMLLMPLDGVDVAELTAAAAALHDRLLFPTAVHLRRATAKRAPNNVGDL